ncbi:Conserved_hypothetical protein [Hexamita inflata]|uniref:Uncharacterized protein n=1 Tax=Hexamita inflata TaxID=28002 RepID=A0AA86P8E2_9EUKA|nr:Conserved hypothetical protein [Hexamita inflata]
MAEIEREQFLSRGLNNNMTHSTATIQQYIQTQQTYKTHKLVILLLPSKNNIYYYYIILVVDNFPVDQNGFHLRFRFNFTFHNSQNLCYTLYYKYINILLLNTPQITEQNLINQLKNQIKYSSLTIEYNDQLQNIEFINEFEIEELTIDNCISIIPKINNPLIKKITLDWSEIKSLKELYLPNLESLSICDDLDYEEGNSVLQHIKQFEKLKQLELYRYSGIDLNLIKELKLTKLLLATCQLKNIELITQFALLKELSLVRNEYVDITPLSQMVRLTVLNLSECCINSVESLKSLTQLVDLNMSNNDIIDISPLQYMNKLKKLDISSNAHKNIHYLQFLKQLTVLNLRECSLIDITYQKPLINLKKLIIAHNNIVYLEPLKELNQINYLDFNFNKILDKSVLDSHHNVHLYFITLLQPDAIEIAFANKLRDINAQNIYIRNMSKLYSNLKIKMTSQRYYIDQCQQQLFHMNYQFIKDVELLFQHLGTQQGSQ